MEPKRKFILGDEWLYLKVYSGPNLLEQILAQELYMSIRKFIQDRWISHFFFIRYADPDYHIRLRLRLTKNTQFEPIIYEINQALSHLITDRSIHKVNYDTYNREMERYGNAIEIVEKIFSQDSISILRYFHHTRLSDEHRWLYSMVWIDELINSFLFSEDRKTTFYQDMCNAYSTEFGIRKPAKVVMDQKYRSLGRKMDAVFYAKEGHSDQYKLMLDEVEAFKTSSGSLVKEILKMQNAEKLSVGLASLTSSIIHMHINRMFRTQQRKYELLIYHFLLKLHSSRIARRSYMKKKDGQKSNEKAWTKDPKYFS